MHAGWWLILGIVAGFVIMAPITRLLLRRGEERARNAERRARDAERLAELGAMTGGLAHEIKNPLSTVGLNAQLLAEGLAETEMPPDRRDRLLRRLESLSREIERLRTILTDFLQFAGRLKLDPQRHNVVRIADELCDFFLPQCEQAGILLRCQLPEEPIDADVDEGLLKQALLNIMLNAVQAISRDAPTDSSGARAGELIISVAAKGNEAVIDIIDTGPGIEPDRREEIFHPYVSGHRGGTGLGLPIARRIVEEHGGTLSLVSERGQGSDFCIRIPRAAHPQDAHRSPDVNDPQSQTAAGSSAG